ncbi:hypothetical protein Tco_1578576 [Tanacetum coccineum]
MEPLPAANQRHPWFRYLIKEYNEGIMNSYEQRLETIWSRPVNRVHVLDFEGLTLERRRLFGIRAPLASEFILEFLSTCRMSDTEMGLDVTDTLCFQLGGVRRRMTWSQFILALGLHTKQEMVEAGFGAYLDGSDRLIPDKGDLKDYWIEISSDRDFLGPTPSYVLIRDLVRRLCHMMITYSIFGKGQAPEKGRKSEARLSGGHFIGRLAMHFGLVNDEGLRGLQAAVAGAHKADEAGLVAEEVALEIPAPEQAPPSPPPWTMSQRIDRLMDASGLTYQAFDSTLVGSSQMPYQRRVWPRTGDASTFATPHTDAQPDP